MPDAHHWSAYDSDARNGQATMDFRARCTMWRTGGQAQAKAMGEVVELEVGEGLESTNDLHGTVVGRRGNHPTATMGGHGQKEANSARSHQR